MYILSLINNRKSEGQVKSFATASGFRKEDRYT